MSTDKSEGFYEMEGTTIFDCEEKKIGRIVDFAFSKEFKLTSFIIEPDRSLIKDEMNQDDYIISYLVPYDTIRRREGKYVYINKKIDELEQIKNHIVENELAFSMIRDSEVIDENLDNLGRIIDAAFHSDHEISFIIGGSGFKEFLKRVGLTPNMHLVLPHRYIEFYKSGKIKISKTRDDLGKSLNRMILDNYGMRMREAHQMAAKEANIVLQKDKMF